MGVERDIAGIALFFIAGTAAGEMLCRAKFMSRPYSSSAATVILAATAALVFLLIYIRYRHLNPATAPTSGDRYMEFIIPAAFLMAGLSGATADFLSCGIRSHDAFPPSASLRDAVISNSESFKAAIDAVPFGDKDCNALTKALLSGDKSDVSREINSAFRDSGASHILALSGMHLGVLYWILLKVTSVFGNFRAVRKVRSCLVILISAWYTLITGASASLVRALLFITLNEAAKMAGRETRPMNIFFIALVIQLTIAPSNVMGAGFQLSYLAMAGIYLVYPKIKSWYPGKRGNPLKWLWDTSALSISCQIFTGPAVWLIFGSFPKYFLLTNLIAVPLSTFIMLLCAAVTFLHHIGICPAFFISVAAESTLLLIHTLEIISTLP